MNNPPIFKPIFGDSWAKLPAVFKKRYANRSYSTDEVVVDGVLNVT